MFRLVNIIVLIFLYPHISSLKASATFKVTRRGAKQTWQILVSHVKCLCFRHSFHPTVSVRLSWFKCWCSNVLEISSASKVFYLSVFLNDASTLQADVFWWWLTFKGLVTVMVSIVTCGAPMLTPAGWAWPAHSNYQPSYRSPHTGRALDRRLWKIFHSYNQKYFCEKYLFLSFCWALTDC